MKATAFIIHLDRATSRRPNVEWLQAQLPLEAEVFPAVDGKQVTPTEISAIYRPHLHRPRYPFPLGSGEIGCFLSHRKVWSEIVARGLDYGFIIEDDVTFEPSAFERAFALAQAHLAAAGYVRMPWHDRETARRVIAEDGNCRLFVPRRTGLGMLSQLVSRQAAEHLLVATEAFDRPVDTTLQMHWATGLRPWSVFPNGIDEISARLGGSTIGSGKTFGQKLRREILRPVYRSRIAIRSSFGHDGKK